MNTSEFAAESFSSNETIRFKVGIVEDQSMVAEFLCFHCRGLGLDVLPLCGTCRDGLAMVREHKPDLLLLDISLPDGDGLQLAKMVLREFPEVKILAISAHRDPWTMLQVQRLGLNGFVDKTEQQREILTKAIRTVLAGEVYYAPIVHRSSASIRRDPKSFIRVLSEYETQILSLIGESKNDDEIGLIVGVKPATIQSRRRDIMIKLNIHATPKLIRYAIENGLTRADQLGLPKIT